MGNVNRVINVNYRSPVKIQTKQSILKHQSKENRNSNHFEHSSSSNLDDFFQQIKKTESLIIREQTIAFSSLFESIVERNLHCAIKILTLSGCQLTNEHLTSINVEMNTTEQIDLSRNEISDLSLLFIFKNLRGINLSHNKLKTIGGIGQWKETLQYFFGGFNPIRSLSEELLECKTLQSVDFNECYIDLTQLPRARWFMIYALSRSINQQVLNFFKIF
jgi:hypothetical protein